MNIYMVERSLKGIAMTDLAAAQKRAIETAAQFPRAGSAFAASRSSAAARPAGSLQACWRAP